MGQPGQRPLTVTGKIEIRMETKKNSLLYRLETHRLIGPVIRQSAMSDQTRLIANIIM